MKKKSCAISLVVILLVLATLVTFLAVPNNTRKIVFSFTCRAIAKTEIFDFDRDHCVKAIAIFLDDETICEDITGEKFATEYKGEKIQFENPPKMECLTEIAADKNAPSICDRVEGVLIASTKIDCLYRVAAKNNSPEACNMIEGSQSRLGRPMDKAGCLAQLKSK